MSRAVLLGIVAQAVVYPLSSYLLSYWELEPYIVSTENRIAPDGDGSCESKNEGDIIQP